MKRWILRILLGAVVAGLLLYLGDWVVFQIRRGPVGVVQVNQLLATPLKGNKMEYDFMGVVPVTCSRSVFPRRGNDACWWVERHKTQWE
ncbi:hypothetical protein P8936_15355 [Edaphobacter paludis]|uniref:Uncharacterized protein n=1 Tax=Edaphobacter paludis TaxID=3035702 RepID=A0AAU7D7D4_9BACT